MTREPEAVAVSQADRDAAGELWGDLQMGEVGSGDGLASVILETMAHAFARHRLASLTAADPAGGELQGGAAEIDSAVCGVLLFGILNGQGDFWTPLAFESEGMARQHIADFWGRNTKMREQCMISHKVVPVRVRLNTLPAAPDALTPPEPAK